MTTTTPEALLAEALEPDRTRWNDKDEWWSSPAGLAERMLDHPPLAAALARGLAPDGLALRWKDYARHREDCIAQPPPVGSGAGCSCGLLVLARETALRDHPPTVAPDTLDAEWLARTFHEAYERMAPRYGYETRRDSAVPWDEVPQKNRDLMRATASVVASAIARQQASGS